MDLLSGLSEGLLGLVGVLVVLLSSLFYRESSILYFADVLIEGSQHVFRHGYPLLDSFLRDCLLPLLYNILNLFLNGDVEVSVNLRDELLEKLRKGISTVIADTLSPVAFKEDLEVPPELFGVAAAINRLAHFIVDIRGASFGQFTISPKVGVFVPLGELEFSVLDELT